MDKNCFNCNRNGTDFYGFTVCEACKKELRLFTPKTIQSHIATYSKAGYARSVQDKLALLENTYIKKRIKLLNILDQLGT